MKTFQLTTLFIVGLFMLGIPCAGMLAWAEEKGKHDTAALAKASQNPVSSLISVPFENNVNFGIGPEDDISNVLNIKPVYPVTINDNWNWIHRAIIPGIYRENSLPGGDDVYGVGDITYQGFLTPAKAGKFIWGVGPVLTMPTGANDLTSDKWSGGPGAVGLMMPGNWVLGGLLFNIWSLGGLGEAAEVYLFNFQYFLTYNMPGGWYLTTGPTITANWEADGGDVWTVPVGGGVGKIFRIGKQPVNLKVAGYYNVHKPHDAANWFLQTQLTFMFPR